MLTRNNTYPCGFDPENCPLRAKARSILEPDPAARLARHFQNPGAAVVFAPTGTGREALALGLKEMGVEVFEIGLHLPVPEAASFLATHLATARARGKKVAVFAPGVEALRRWAENIWPSFRDMLEERPHPAGLLVVAVGIADQETERLFGVRREEFAPGQAAVLV